MQDRSIGKSGDDPAAVGGGQGHETDVRGDKMVWEVVCLAERANGWVRVKGGELWSAGGGSGGRMRQWTRGSGAEGGDLNLSVTHTVTCRGSSMWTVPKRRVERSCDWHSIYDRNYYILRL